MINPINRRTTLTQLKADNIYGVIEKLPYGCRFDRDPPYWYAEIEAWANENVAGGDVYYPQYRSAGVEVFFSTPAMANACAVKFNGYRIDGPFGRNVPERIKTLQADSRLDKDGKQELKALLALMAT